MAKRVISLSKVGASASGPPGDLVLQGPRKPIRLGQQEAPSEDLSRTQPMKRIVVAAGAQKRRVTGAARTTRAGAASSQQQQRKPVKKSSGPPLWLIPVGIIGLVILIVIIVSATSNAKRDPYFSGGPVVQQQTQQPQRMRRDVERPMKEWMERHGESDMAKQRRERMHGRGRTNTSNGQ